VEPGSREWFLVRIAYSVLRVAALRQAQGTAAFRPPPSNHLPSDHCLPIEN